MRVVFHPAAQADLDDLIFYIAGRAGQSIAEKQLDRSLASLDILGEFPRTSTYHRSLDVYESWLPRTRFIAFYRIRDDLDAIVVLAIIDHSRNTDRRRRRTIKSRG